MQEKKVRGNLYLYIFAYMDIYLLRFKRVYIEVDSVFFNDYEIEVNICMS